MKFKLVFRKKKHIRSTFIFTIALLIFSNGFSQKLTPGVRAGFNFSNWNLSGVNGVEPLSVGGGSAGIFATLHISRYFSVEPAVNLAYMGCKLEYSDMEHITSKLTYLQIPIVARYQLQNRLAFFSGPQLSFLLKATMNENEGEKQNAKAAFKKNDLSIVSGMEYYFLTGIGIRANYTAGLTDIYAQGSEKITNYSFGISVGYKFHQQRKTTGKK